MTGLWHCYNCSTKFDGEIPFCPKCKADAREPEMAHLVVQREIIHYCPPHDIIVDRSTRVRVCDGVKYGDQGKYWTFTPVATCATCPQCLAKLAESAPVPTEEEPPNGV